MTDLNANDISLATGNTGTVTGNTGTVTGNTGTVTGNTGTVTGNTGIRINNINLINRGDLSVTSRGRQTSKPSREGHKSINLVDHRTVNKKIRLPRHVMRGKAGQRIPGSVSRESAEPKPLPTRDIRLQLKKYFFLF
jgi:hypothetical protein